MKNLIYIFLIIIISSCSTKKQINYLQDIDLNDSYSNKYMQYKIKVDDILKISINSNIPELSNGLDVKSNSGSNLEYYLLNGYQVDSNGYIYLPDIDSLLVEGKTIPEIRNTIYEKIVIDKKILLNPSIDVKLISSHFIILGEVNKPGKYEFLENNLNVFEAIGMAGDLTINGLRKDVKVIRDVEGKKDIFSLDLTKSELLNNNKYQIFSGDIIIVNPNSARVKNAGIIGNSGTLISLLSFLLSSIIVLGYNN